MKRNHVKKAIAVTAFAIMIIIGETKSYAASDVVVGGTGGYYTEGSSQFGATTYMAATYCATDASLSINGYASLIRVYDNYVQTKGISNSGYTTQIVVRENIPNGYKAVSVRATHKVVKNGTWTGYTYAK